MKNLVFFLEERSAKEMLKKFIPRLFPDRVNPICIVFNGKQDLEKKLIKRLNGWNKPRSVFVILVDQDQENCKSVKQRLIEKCDKSKSSHQIIIRIACHELESWYFGDLEAVSKALQKPGLIRYREKREYRSPDKIRDPSEKLAKITNGIYQKVSSSRDIGCYLSVQSNTNRSHSFKVFIKGIEKII